MRAEHARPACLCVAALRAGPTWGPGSQEDPVMKYLNNPQYAEAMEGTVAVLISGFIVGTVAFAVLF